MLRTIFLCLLFFHGPVSLLFGQQQYELNSGWKCINIKNIAQDGAQISNASYRLDGFMDATVPGTVLTTLLNNGKIPDPFYGMNNEKIADIYDTGRDFYTYWFVKDFTETRAAAGQQVWLHFRGINYSCDVYLNGHKLNEKVFSGMFLRQTYNITRFLAKDGNNRLAVIVYPPDPVGNPNGGQGGDGTIARNVSNQYVAGWDWIQPVRDRNTGIWDKVTIEKTGVVDIRNPHVITLIPGIRRVSGTQMPAILKVSAELLNPTNSDVRGVLKYSVAGETVSKTVSLSAGESLKVTLPDLKILKPKLWWPNGYGKQDLYHINLEFDTEGKGRSDSEDLSFGIREINTVWNAETRSREIRVNGQKIFIKGGNWIISDAMLRFSPERYAAEVRFHRDMNLNLIRIWGGAITERPEFYAACDRYGLLVMQDFWMSGDCNGRWLDPKKKDDQWTRRQYPDDHDLFITSVADQVKMIRNHPSLALWCGGNEIVPPGDILRVMRDSLLPALDGTRYFFEYSNSDSMSYNAIGGNGDGPYGIQDIRSFWERRDFPFNSEIGSVGLGDYASVKRFIPAENMLVPGKGNAIDSVWQYHKYLPYGQHPDVYGKTSNVNDFLKHAQLVNYDQYRALAEGYTSHMWDWYTGVIIWKTQNPWTAMRGQMYDYYLDPNAGLYGLRKGAESLHVMYDPTDGMVFIANNHFEPKHNLMLQAKTFDMKGKETLLTQVFSDIGPTRAKKYLSLKRSVDQFSKNEGAFLLLRLMDEKKNIVSDNLYWLADSTGNYSGLQQMQPAGIVATITKVSEGNVQLSIQNPPGNPVAFFNRISVVNSVTKERFLPSFFSDNYVSVLPGEHSRIEITYPSSKDVKAAVEISGWNVETRIIEIQ